MARFKSVISQHRDRCNELHSKVHATFLRCKKSEQSKAEWQTACRDFREFRTEVDDLLEKVDTQSIETEPSIREFVFDYISIDPVYFGSGYAKERLLSQLKKVKLSDDEKEIFRRTILQRVKNGAYREFKHYCRFIPQIASESFIEDLHSASCSHDESIQSRAKFALNYLDK